MKKIFVFTIMLFVGTLGLVLYPGLSQAQGIDIVNANDVLLSTTPELPGPFEETDISLESFVVNLDTSRITWIVDGQELLSGVGEKSISVTTRDLGDPLLVEVRIRWNPVDTLVKRVRIEPAYVDLLWEAPDSYTPPFYRGKALPGSEAYFKAVALPSGVIVNDQYVYTWEHNGDVKPDQSGFKKNSFTVLNNFFDKRFKVGVTVSGRLTPFRAQAQLIVPRFDPEIRFAVESITGERITKQNNGFTVDGQFNRLIAHPYYFSAADVQGFQNLEFNWSIDGESYVPGIGLSRRENEIPLVSPAEGSGLSNISVEVFNRNEILQQASAETQIRF